jgi:SAM-dependent methyltransferase
VQGDMRRIPFEGGFNAVVNLFTSFGYFEREEEHQRVLREIHKSLKPGGRLLMETANREWLIRRFQAHDWHEFPDFILLEEREFKAEESRLDAKWIKLYGDGTRKEYSHSLRLFTLAELFDLFAQPGLTVLGYYGSLKGEPWSLETNRLVLVAERPSS